MGLGCVRLAGTLSQSPLLHGDELGLGSRKSWQLQVEMRWQPHFPREGRAITAQDVAAGLLAHPAAGAPASLPLLRQLLQIWAQLGELYSELCGLTVSHGVGGGGWEAGKAVWVPDHIHGFQLSSWVPTSIYLPFPADSGPVPDAGDRLTKATYPAPTARRSDPYSNPLQ